LFASLFGVDYQLAMVVSAVVIVLYTCLGGFSAASTTDFIQSIVMSIALVIVVVFGVNVAGGMDAVMANANELPGYLSLTAMYDAVNGAAVNYGFITIVSTMAWGLGYFGMPHILLRFMAIEDEKKLPMARRVGSIWVVISLAVAIFIGVVGYSVSKAGAVQVLQGSASETIIVEMASLLSKNGLVFACMAGLILAGILASTMSTADSQLLAASSSVSENILKGFFNINLSGKMTVLAARTCLVTIAAIGIILAGDPNSSVFGIVSFAWAGFGAAFGPVVLAALFWKRSNMYGALAGMVTGGVTVFVWKYLIRPMGGAWNIYELLPAFLLAMAAIVIVSLLTPAPSKEIQDEFEEVKAICK
jgi:sodium/proline symporter